MKLYKIKYEQIIRKKNIFGDPVVKVKNGEDYIFSDRTKKDIIREYNNIHNFQTRHVESVTHYKPRKL